VTRALAGISIVALLSVPGFGQTAEKPAAFDIADMHVSPHVTNPFMRGGVLRGDRYTVRTATMVDLISAAYGVDSAKVQGGPRWLDTDRFDIIAKAPASTPRETVKAMLQTLLADRFKLKVHTDSKPLPVFALSVGRGKPQLKPSDGSGDSGCRPQPPQNPQPAVIPLSWFPATTEPWSNWRKICATWQGAI
jgi:uncharacterized protein (TIGR03435 family)